MSTIYSDDDFEDYFDDRSDYYDANLELPNYFITCFNHTDIPKYQTAIDLFVAQNPGTAGSLEIDMSGQWNSTQSPALLCWNRGDLTAFWKIFETL